MTTSASISRVTKDHDHMLVSGYEPLRVALSVDVQRLLPEVVRVETQQPAPTGGRSLRGRV